MLLCTTNVHTHNTHVAPHILAGQPIYLLGTTATNAPWQGVVDVSEHPSLTLPPSAQLMDLRSLMSSSSIPPAQLSLAGYATSLVAWHQVCTSVVTRVYTHGSQPIIPFALSSCNSSNHHGTVVMPTPLSSSHTRPIATVADAGHPHNP